MEEPFKGDMSFTDSMPSNDDLKAAYIRGRRTKRAQVDLNPADKLAASITKAASKQTYYTIRFLADHERIQDAYSAYAYFRWVDDVLDERLSNSSQRLAFVERQQALVNSEGDRDWSRHLTVEEQMVVRLIHRNPNPESGLRAYIQNMMAVMTFDANRRGRLITQQELSDYSRSLAVAVTEALHYFIGHDDPSPKTEMRYQAVTGAHITHMLRDTFEDVSAGYFNVPREFLEAHQIHPQDVDSEAYREWIKERVALARACFKAGRDYIAQVQNRRCRIAGSFYTARFEVVLDAIERENYHLRADYPERKRIGAALRMGWSVLNDAFIFASSRQLVSS